ncbi:hypothetical protein EII31_05925 [Leucobacter sp. OH2974_COT-288]|nr:hypothetical protein EII31_05925 [Leucobacter sp. OH2974_COT-288]
MSVSLFLVPMALTVTAGVMTTHKTQQAKEKITDSAVTSQPVHETNSPETTVLQVQTRMRDTGLLVRAFSELGATVHEANQDMVVAELQHTLFTMQRDSTGVWAAHAEAVAVGRGRQRQVTAETAAEMLRQLDATYGRLVQQAVVERIHAQAANVGMQVSSQTVEEDQSIRIVLDTVSVES